MTDLDRIMGLRKRPTKKLALPNVNRLRPNQVSALTELQTAPAPKGAVVGLGVGDGKTLVGLLSGVVTKAASVLALVPSPLTAQWAAEARRWCSVWDYPDPEIIGHGWLSRPQNAQALMRRKWDLVVIDEAHAFKRIGSARTRRLLTYAVRNPKTRFVVMSGSFANDSLRDYAHLLELALREDTPVPLNDHLLRSWCAVLDHDGEPAREDWETVWFLARKFGRKDPGPLKWGYERLPLHERERLVRRGFQARLKTAPGVVLAPPGAITAGLRLRVLRADPHPNITAALDRLNTTWTLPDGGELVDAPEMARARQTLSRGYYERFAWPDGPDEVWLNARREWHREVRAVLEYRSRPGLDSPALVATAASEGRLGARTGRLWKAWAAIASRWPKGPPRELVWLDGCKAWLRGIVTRWLGLVPPKTKNQPRALLWYRNKGTEEVLTCPTFGAGSNKPPTTVPYAGVSISVHGTGTDGLQHGWAHGLVLDLPSNAQAYEQLIGRLHRPGQTAPFVQFDLLCVTWSDKRTLDEVMAKTEVMATLNAMVAPKMAVGDWLTPGRV